MKKSLESKLDAIKIKVTEVGTTPVWKGPAEDGITFSLLSRYLADKERFRILAIEGLRAREGFSFRMEFGNMWHVLEESLASEVHHFGERVGTTLGDDIISNYVSGLCKRFPLSREEIGTCYEMVRAMFPVYIRYWEKHPDMKGREPVFAEKVFDVPYRLPSGRDVRLRGKWDGFDVVKPARGRGKPVGWLQENKTKSEVDPNAIVRQLSFDLQTMMYLVALDEAKRGSDPDLVKLWSSPEIGGVRYNVVRRPRHKQGKRESREDFYQRLTEVVESEADTFFHRWNVEVTKDDIDRFRRECLDPVLENLTDDYEWWSYCVEPSGRGKTDPFDGVQRSRLFPHHCPRHSRMPFGVYSPLLEGGSTDLDEYLTSGSEAGLERTDNLFRELESSPT